MPAAVIPGGMYGHQSVNRLPADVPAVLRRAARAPHLGRRRQRVRRLHVQLRPDHARPPATRGRGRGRGAAGAGRLPERPGAGAWSSWPSCWSTASAHADWAMFAKNGTDATTICRDDRARRRPAGRKVLAADGRVPRRRAVVLRSPDGVDRRRTAPTCATTRTTTSPASRPRSTRPAATTSPPSSCRRSGTTPGSTRSSSIPAFARGLRALCDEIGAALILDDVRAGFRLHHGGSWEPLGVAARPRGVEQGDRQRLRRSPRCSATTARATARERIFVTGLVLVPGRADGGRDRDDRGAPGRGRRRHAWSAVGHRLRDGFDRAGRGARRRRSARPARSRCRS